MSLPDWFLQIGNVVLKKPATKGFEHLPAVCIQAHLDMVCSKNNGTVHDFAKDPINLRIDGEWLKATGTTLGADDGIGVAACLAMMEDQSYSHPALECLLTVDEETTMVGAEKLDSTILRAKYLVNVDSEEENSICFGCAGGSERLFHIPVTRSLPEKPHTLLHVTLGGLAGGHSGVQIHEGLGNAVQFMTRMLRRYAAQDPEFFLLGLEAGTAINTIPRECSAFVGIPVAHSRQLRDSLQATFTEITREYRVVEKNATLSVKDASQELLHAHEDARPLSHESSLRVLDFLASIPHGVLRMSPDVPGLVETSNCLSIVKLHSEHLAVEVFARSSSDSQLSMVEETYDSLARIAGATVNKSTNKFPGWLPEPSSKSLGVVKKVHEELLGVTPKIYAVHAGLECGLIKNRYPNMDCVSIGPEIKDAHTPDERLLIASVPRFATLLKGTLEAFTKHV